MGILVCGSVMSNYPLHLAAKFPAILGSISGPYLVSLYEGKHTTPYDLYTSSLTIVAALGHLGLTVYLAFLEERPLDMFKLFVKNGLILSTLAISGAAILLVFSG